MTQIKPAKKHQPHECKYITPLRESTITVLSTMAQVTATPGEPTVKKSNQPLGDVTGMINFSGK